MQSDRTLDWERRFSPKSLKYKVSAQVPNLKTRNIQWKRSIWLDQGQEGACTGFGLSHVLGTTPRKSKLVIDNEFARHRYQRAKQKDEWAGESYEGSSVLGAMEAAKEDGLITSYAWCTTMEELDHAISYLGPVEIGVDWYEGMFYPDSDGLLHISGKIAGGHALQVGGRNASRRLYRLDNSWGPDWGVHGSAYISFEDMARLMSQHGEFAVARKVR